MRLTNLAVAAAVLVSQLSMSAHASARSGSYSMQVVEENGLPLPAFQQDGRTYVLGAKGQRYRLQITNHSARRVEVVTSVDGRDVLDGNPASFSKRGYLVGPYATVTIDGFRLSDASVAAFRFSSVSDSYAAQLGDARDVGVIGVAVFPEFQPRYVYRPPRPGYRGGRDFSNRAPSASEEAQPRSGLGTEFGEQRESYVNRVDFTRASSSPETLLEVRYDDRAGLLSAGVDLDGNRWAYGREDWSRENADPFRQDSTYAQPPPGWRR